MKNPVKNLILLTVLMLSFASVVYAAPVNCAVTPGDPACAPTFQLTFKVGNGPQQSVNASAPSYANGAWTVSFIPQTVPFIFTGGTLITSPDPFVGFSFGVANTTNSVMTFTYDYMTPYAGGPYNAVRSIFGDSLANGSFGPAVTATPTVSSYMMNTYDTGNLLTQVNLGKGCTTSGVCSSPDDGVIGPLLYTSFATGTLEVKGSFTLTPGSQYTLTGRSELLTIPEPGTLALLGSGILGLAGFLRKRLLF